MARQRKSQQQQQRGQSKSELKSATHAMLGEAEGLLREGRADDALPVALRALDTLRGGAAGKDGTAALPALNLVAEIYLELGDAPTARSYFLKAVTLDPEGQIPTSNGGGAEKFLYLAQLSEQGGQDSVDWFSRGATILRREIALLESHDDGPSSSSVENEGGEEDYSKRKKLAEALCGIIEVYMTDLSWEPTAESRCEELISEALLIAPHCAEPLQTLASIRISQGRITEARKALRDSMDIWTNLPNSEEEEEEEEDDDDDRDLRIGSLPDFATRISLSRLLMEVNMSESALSILERLISEDDSSVEAWYLGGWCLYLLAQGKKPQNEKAHSTEDATMNGDNSEVTEKEDGEEDLYTQSLVSSRQWLGRSLKLYDMVEYEDERLREHAVVWVGAIAGVVGVVGSGEAEEEEEEEWNGFGDDGEEEEEREREDEEMEDG